jgi:hypothetical protein
MKTHSTANAVRYHRLRSGKQPRTISHTNSHGKNLFAVQHTRVRTRKGDCRAPEISQNINPTFDVADVFLKYSRSRISPKIHGVATDFFLDCSRVSGTMLYETVVRTFSPLRYLDGSSPLACAKRGGIRSIVLTCRRVNQLPTSSVHLPCHDDQGAQITTFLELLPISVGSVEILSDFGPVKVLDIPLVHDRLRRPNSASRCANILRPESD